MDSLTLDAFFALLRTGLWSDSTPDLHPLSQEQWGEILTMAKEQTVLGLVADAVSRLPKESAPSVDTMRYLLMFSTRLMMTHAKLDAAVAKVADFYRSNGIEGVLLKGQGIARCYNTPHLRMCGDIDYYVGEDNYAESVTLAIKHLETDHAKSKETEKHYEFCMDDVEVELHRIAAQMTAPGRRRVFQRWLVAELEDSSRLRSLDICGTHVLTPSADFDVFFIFYHAWWHLLDGGIGLRHLCDWAMALHCHADIITSKSLETLLSRLKYVRPWQILGSIVVERLGLPAEMMPLYDPKIGDKYQWVTDRIMEGGNFGANLGLSNAERRKMPFLKRKMTGLKNHIDVYAKVFPILPMETLGLTARFLAVAGMRTIRQLARVDD